MIGKLCLDAHLPKRGNLYMQCAPYKPGGIQECYTFNFIFIYNYFNVVFLRYELSTIFTIYSIYQCIFCLDIFVSFLDASLLIT